MKLQKTTTKPFFFFFPFPQHGHKIYQLVFLCSSKPRYIPVLPSSLTSARTCSPLSTVLDPSWAWFFPDWHMGLIQALLWSRHTHTNTPALTHMQSNGQLWCFVAFEFIQNVKRYICLITSTLPRTAGSCIFRHFILANIFVIGAFRSFTWHFDSTWSAQKKWRKRRMFEVIFEVISCCDDEQDSAPLRDCYKR